MKFKVLLFLSVAFLAFEKIQAQNEIKFTSTNFAGLLTGNSESSFQLQSINGLRYKEFTAGIGVGMDNYYFKSIPVFLHVTRSVFSKNKSPFVYADIGLNFPQDRDSDKDTWQNSSYSKGFYCDLGFGYSVPLYKKISMIFSLGYSQKHLEEERTGGYYIGFPNRVFIDLPSEYYSYTFRRISLKAGLSF